MIDIKWDGLTEVIVPSKCTCEEILMDDKFMNQFIYPSSCKIGI